MPFMSKYAAFLLNTRTRIAILQFPELLDAYIELADPGS